MPTKLSASCSDDSDGSETLWSCSVVVQEKPYDVIEFANSMDNKRNKEYEFAIKEQQQKHHNINIDGKKQKPLKLSKGVSKKTLESFTFMSVTNK